MEFRYLKQDELLELTTVALRMGLGNPMTQMTLLSSLNPQFAGSIQTLGLSPSTMLLNTLNRLNHTERLTDGSVPLAAWLKSALAVAGPVEDAKVFAQALSVVSQRSSGAPPIELENVPERKERIIHQDDMVSFGFFTGAVAAGAAVTLVTVPRYDGGARRMLASGGEYLSQGTAWLLTPELAITNHHVINARQEGEAAAARADLELQAANARLGFDFDSKTQVPESVAVAKLESCDPGLDYAVLRLARRQSRRPLAVKAGLVAVGTPVNIIQHPLGQEKKIACRNNLVTANSPTELRYFTDTQQGSSGAPVLDDTWRVVALHRSSVNVENVNFQGKSTAWVNVGVPIGRVLEHIRQNAPEALWREIRQTQAELG
ncbi:trypsin-like peptidase domain-containing protein [Cystobacter fuscus]|uniref:trypsin-like peptidase domain-containing protein n=1 Tax=Cystobacter fuscus TaxID=43 RepID=UPI0005BA5361|nr:trypsin-like peptidase domain-containing protein [Cystobacter fuscus]